MPSRRALVDPADPAERRAGRACADGMTTTLVKGKIDVNVEVWTSGRVPATPSRERERAPMLPSPEDHTAISNLMARYCLTLDHDDVDGWVSLFTPDATYEVYGRAYKGHEGLRAIMAGAPGGLHLGGPPVIEMVDADRARDTRNLLFVLREDGSSRSAVYTDELVRTPEGWRITACRCRFMTPTGLADRPPRPAR
jgi:hypothetical protein